MAAVGSAEKPAEAGRASAAAKRSYPVRTLLLGLVLVLAIPLNLVIAATIWSLTRTARDAQLQALRYSAESVAAAVDSSTGRYIALAEALTRSPSLAAGDFAAFHAEAKRTVQLDGAWVIVADQSGQMLLNTSQPFGAPLPPRTSEGRIYQARAEAEHKTLVSGVYRGLLNKEWIVSIETATTSEAGGRYAVALVVPVKSFVSVLNPSNIPNAWLAGIMDQTGRYVARLPDPDATVGAMASTGWRSVAGVEGVSEFVSREGEPVINANAVSEASGWTIGVAAKKRELDMLALRATSWFIGAALAVSLASIVLAIMLARWITHSLLSLSAASADLVRGEPVTFDTNITEFRRLWRALRRTAQERAKADALALESETRLRRAGEAARFGVYDFDPATQTAVCSSRVHRILGTNPTERLSLAGFLDRLDPADRETARARMLEVQRRAGPYEFSHRIVGPDGGVRWIVDMGEAIGPIDARTGLVARLTGTIIDATEQKLAEERNNLLVREVSHRSKNLMSVVLAVARRTGADSVPEYVRRFTNRLRGLASNQDLLVRNDWRGIAIGDLVTAQIEPFHDVLGGRLLVSGPRVELSPEAAQAIGMALHELATNATKYGALSNETGTVDISWRIDGEDLEILWRERGGQPVSEPARNGFGVTVMTSLVQLALGGAVELSFPPEGVTWRLKCPAKAAMPR
ncbi:MAG: HWE histidine kinase domain-containing protein [Beijerinckiaceae bacterium]